MERTKILLDTDIGDDIDDLLCLQLGLNLPQVEFVGITTVFKNTVLRARMVKKVLEINGADIPVYAGSGNGIEQKNDISQTLCQYDETMDESRFAPVNEKENCSGDMAVDFIIDTVKRYGKELTILGIGPFTNIAKAILKDPETMKGVGRIVVMGGAFFNHFTEWNSLCDAEASRVISEFEVPIEYISADVTHRCSLTDEEYRFVTGFKEGYKGYLSEKIKMWRKTHINTHAAVFLHDPLALMYIVDPSVVKMKKVHVYVEKCGTKTRGMTLNLDDMYCYSPHKPMENANFASYDVNEKLFVKKFIEIVFGKKEEK